MRSGLLALMHRDIRRSGDIHTRMIAEFFSEALAIAPLYRSLTCKVDPRFTVSMDGTPLPTAPRSVRACFERVGKIDSNNSFQHFSKWCVDIAFLG
jgi:hypothetical protein